MASFTPIAVIAIDFGTTYSGYAFAFTSAREKIFMSKNWGGTIQECKTPTSLLVSKTSNGGYEAAGFGQQAEEDYGEAMIFGDDNDEKMYLFRRFKMQLFRRGIQLDPEMKLSSDDGSLKLPALQVFGLALGYLKKKALEALNQGRQNALKDDEVRWVLTVPAIWSESAKDFMRSAAHKGGLIPAVDSERLVIALEPEAASVYCRNSSVEGSINIPAGSQYLIVDSGGGTIDIASHEITESGNIKELYKPSGGDWGGSYVDEAFETLIAKVLGDRFVKEAKENHAVAWLELMNSFEKKKREKTKKCNIPIQEGLSSAYKKIMTGDIDGGFAAYNKRGETGVSSGNGHMKFNENIIQALFNPLISKIVGHLETLLKRPALKEIGYLVLVGGFSESKYLQEAIQRKFSSKYKVIIPQETVLAVAKGAVMFGYKKSVIESRVAQHTYGIAVNEGFDQQRHGNRETIAGPLSRDVVRDIFSVFVNKDDIINIKDKCTHEVYPSRRGRHKAILKMFSTDKKLDKGKVHYIDRDMEELGSVLINVSEDCHPDKPLYLDFYFGGTEIHVEVRPSADSKNVIATARLSCLKGDN